MNVLALVPKPFNNVGANAVGTFVSNKKNEML